jgi:hypothetical protein
VITTRRDILKLLLAKRIKLPKAIADWIRSANREKRSVDVGITVCDFSIRRHFNRLEDVPLSRDLFEDESGSEGRPFAKMFFADKNSPENVEKSFANLGKTEAAEAIAGGDFDLFD